MARVREWTLITEKRTEMMHDVISKWCLMYSLPFKFWRHDCIDESSCSYITRRPAKVRRAGGVDEYGDAEDRLDCLAFIVGQLRGEQFTTPEIRKVLDLSAGTTANAMDRYRAMSEETKRMMLQASGLQGKEAVRRFTQGAFDEKRIHD
jgi:hypothetical protein